jgi:hypothetical protein
MSIPTANVALTHLFRFGARLFTCFFVGGFNQRVALGSASRTGRLKQAAEGAACGLACDY